MPFKLTCYGGAEIVTGSNFMVEGSQGKILIDCGLEQGSDFVEREMYAPFPFDASQIDAVVVTHAHLDHVGRLPKLMREGFKGKVYMTPPTRDLTALILADSVHIMAEEAEKHHLDPLFTDVDVEELFKRVETIEYHTETEVAPGMTVFLRNTGHILGSASVRVQEEDGTTLAFTGDIGHSPEPYLPNWEPITDADVILMESVYGDRANPDKNNRVQLLRDALRRALARGGTILMPTFSMERTQLLLYEIGKLVAAGELPETPIYLDSPLAIKITEVYEKWEGTYFNQAAEKEAKAHDLFKFPFLHMSPSRRDSEDIDKQPNPKIIMAGAGMSHGGRIGAHEWKYLPDPKTTLFIVGYQAPGTLGRLLQDGASSMRIEGKQVKVRAKVETFTGWSAHADRDELLEFARKALPPDGKTKTFLIGLGEPSSARFLAQRIHDFLGAKAIVPMKGESFEISKDGVRRFTT